MSALGRSRRSRTPARGSSSSTSRRPILPGCSRPTGAHGRRRSCRSAASRGCTDREAREAGFAQATHIAALTEAAIDRILAASERPPVIVVMSDHGPGDGFDPEFADDVRPRGPCQQLHGGPHARAPRAHGPPADAGQPVPDPPRRRTSGRRSRSSRTRSGATAGRTSTRSRRRRSRAGPSDRRARPDGRRRAPGDRPPGPSDVAHPDRRLPGGPRGRPGRRARQRRRRQPVRGGPRGGSIVIVLALLLSAIGRLLLGDKDRGGILAALWVIALLGGDDRAFLLVMAATTACSFWSGTRLPPERRTIRWWWIGRATSRIAGVIALAVLIQSIQMGTLADAGTVGDPRDVPASGAGARRGRRRPTPTSTSSCSTATAAPTSCATSSAPTSRRSRTRSKRDGFDVAAASRSNYTNTSETLSSMFSATHLQDMPSMAELLAGTEARPPGGVVREAINDNATLRLLHGRGYEVEAIVSGWEQVTMREADHVVDTGQINEFEIGILRRSLVGHAARDGRARLRERPAARPDQRGLRERSRRRRRDSGRVRGSSSPTCPSPHPPWVYHEDGSPRTVVNLDSIYGETPASMGLIDRRAQGRLPGPGRSTSTGGCSTPLGGLWTRRSTAAWPPVSRDHLLGPRNVDRRRRRRHPAPVQEPPGDPLDGARDIPLRQNETLVNLWPTIFNAAVRHRLGDAAGQPSTASGRATTSTSSTWMTRTTWPARRLPAMSAAASLTIVLPAYNEAERIGPALDELFGYLRRRGERARDGSPGAAGLPGASTSSSSTTAAPTGPPRSWPRVRKRSDSPGPAKLACVSDGAARRQGRRRPGRDARRRRRPRRLRRRRHGDAARPAARCSSTRPRRPRRRPRLADPARRLGHAHEPAGLPPAARQGLPRSWPRSGSSVRSRTRSAGSRASRARPPSDLFERQRITSIVFDVELIYLARRRGYRLAIVPIHWYDRRGSRMRARPGLALRVAWDLFRIPLIHRGERRGARRPRDRRQSTTSSLARAALPIVAILVFGGVVGRPSRSPATRSASTSSPTTRRRPGSSTVSRVYDMTFESSGGFGLFYYPPHVRARSSSRSALPPATTASGSGPGCSIAAFLVGVAVLPVLRDRPLVDRPARRPVVAVRLRGQARPGRADPVPAVRDRLALAGRPGPASA